MKYAILIFMLALCGCGNKNRKDTKSDDVEESVKREGSVNYFNRDKNLFLQTNSGVKLTTGQEEYSIKNNDVFDYSIHNLDNYQVLTGSSFILHFWNGEVWLNSPFESVFYNLLNIIRKDSKKSYRYYLLNNEEYPMKLGKCQIIKDIEVLFKEGVRKENFQLYCVFFYSGIKGALIDLNQLSLLF